MGGLFQHVWAWDTKQGTLPSQDLSKEKAKGIWGQRNGPGSGETVTSERRPEANLPEGWGGPYWWVLPQESSLAVGPGPSTGLPRIPGDKNTPRDAKKLTEINAGAQRCFEIRDWFPSKVSGLGPEVSV